MFSLFMISRKNATILFRHVEGKYDISVVKKENSNSIKVCVRLNNFTKNEETGLLEFASSVDEEVFFCDLP